jgi:hypothetical protein
MTMPINKDLKRLVRARMRKTGEAYTAARAQLIIKPHARTSSRAAAAAPPPAPLAVPAQFANVPGPKDYAAIAGMSDESVKKKTGCTWERWVRALDRLDADRMPHRDIVKLVSGKYGADSWWSQMITVGYERIKGLRARGQRRDGTYELSKSRTFGVPVTALFDAWADAGLRRRWLDGAMAKVRTATAPKSMRLGWSDGGIVEVGFTAKGKSKSVVAVAHTKLADRETADRLKRYWSERFDALGEVLAAT